MSSEKKVIILSAPSGSGKTSLAKNCLDRFEKLRLSVSCTTRKPRKNEENGRDYHFFSIEEFKRKIEENAFVEYEEVYENFFYGTLHSEIEKIWKLHCAVIFDVDVKGGINLKKIYQENALSIFIAPPSIKELEKRLLDRGTESDKAMKMRLAKAEEEISYATIFDKTIVNKDLEKSKQEIETLVREFLER